MNPSLDRLVSQCDRGINLRRPPRKHVSGDQGDHRKIAATAEDRVYDLLQLRP